jgi:hypothetical protein
MPRNRNIPSEFIFEPVFNYKEVDGNFLLVILQLHIFLLGFFLFFFQKASHIFSIMVENLVILK